MNDLKNVPLNIEDESRCLFLISVLEELIREVDQQHSDNNTQRSDNNIALLIRV